MEPSEQICSCHQVPCLGHASTHDDAQVYDAARLFRFFFFCGKAQKDKKTTTTEIRLAGGGVAASHSLQTVPFCPNAEIRRGNTRSLAAYIHLSTFPLRKQFFHLLCCVTDRSQQITSSLQSTTRRERTNSPRSSGTPRRFLRRRPCKGSRT